MLLRDMGLDPASDEARRTVGLVRDRVVWQGWAAYDGNPFFAGEVEPCINRQSGRRYDLIFDAVGNCSVSDYQRVLSPNGICGCRVYLYITFVPVHVSGR